MVLCWRLKPHITPVQWVEASGEDVYPGLAEEYRRLVMLVNVGGEDHYVVDLFRVRGGDQRDWVMHGSADVDMRTETNVPLQHYGENLLPGVKVRFPEHERDQGDAEGRNVSLAFFQNVLHSDHVQDARVTFHGDDVAVRIHLVGLADSELFVGDAPSVRRADEDEPLLDQFRMPMLMVRQKGRSPSRFMAVHEPFRNKAFIDSVEVEDIGERGVYLKVRHQGGTDHIVLQPGTEVFRMGDLTFQGEVGFVREQDGEARVMGLWGGEKVQWQTTRLTGGGIYTGQVTDVLRIEDGAPYHALVVNGLSEIEDIDGAVAVVTFGDGTTRGLRVQRMEGEQIILEDDPGFRITNTGMAHCFFPLREIEGAVQLQIRTSAFVIIRDGGVERHAVDSSEFEVK